MDMKTVETDLNNALAVLENNREITRQEADWLFDNEDVFDGVQRALQKYRPRTGREAVDVLVRVLRSFIDQIERSRGGGDRYGNDRDYGRGGRYDDHGRGGGDIFGRGGGGLDWNEFLDRERGGSRGRDDMHGTGVDFDGAFTTGDGGEPAEKGAYDSLMDRVSGRERRAAAEEEQVPAPKPAIIKGPTERSVSPCDTLIFTELKEDKATALSIETSYRTCGCDENGSEKTADVYKFQQVGKIGDGSVHPVDTFVVVNSIPEFDVLESYRNIVNSNVELQNGRHIVMVQGHFWQLHNVGEDQFGDIDPKKLLEDDGTMTSNAGKLKAFIDEMRGDSYRSGELYMKNLMSALNERAERWLRAELSGATIAFSDLDDVCATLGKSKMGTTGHPIMDHPTFPTLLMEAFIDALASTTSEISKNGIVNMGDAINDILKHPDFVVRKQGITERDTDITSGKKIELLSKMFTVTLKRRLICYANFIPEGLEEDLDSLYILLDRDYNAIDKMVTAQEMWPDPLDFVCMQDNKIVTYRNGVDYGENRILFTADDILENKI